MTRRFLSALPLLLLLGAPTFAGDLSGLWDVTGTLPDGRKYTALAAVSPGKTAQTYRIMGRGKLSNRTLVWRANAKREGDTLHVRHFGRGGIVGRLSGNSGKKLLGTYTIDANEQAFAGQDRLEGETDTGAVTFVKKVAPKVTFAPGSLELRLKKSGVVEVTTDPPGAVGLLWFQGPVERSYWSGKKRKVEVQADTSGTYTVKARLGSLRGPVLAELKVRVGPGVLKNVEDAVKQAKADGKTPIVIFDLDDTLFDTRYRVREILRDYGAVIDEPRLKTLSASKVMFKLEETLKNAGFTQAEIEGDLGKKIQRAWRKRFWTDYHLDRPMRGAKRYAEKLVAAGAVLHFITGRKQKYYTDSLAKLAEDSFPEGTLHCKPNDYTAGTPAFKKGKTTALLAAQPNAVVIAAFDNEPPNCTAFKQAAPKAFVVWIESQWKEMPEHVEMAPGVVEIGRGYR